MLKKLESMKFDRRLVERQLRDTTLTEKEYSAYLSKLEDDAENVTYVEFEHNSNGSDDGELGELTFTPVSL
ncbi:MAG: hypothetical protein COX62_05470 [Deltaproteobacteria bacterium CG_4_10_14_0_2_um_filter_43_8]|nr:MAG: hypothetical protein COV43_01545 [Deltaproteobacteria bacterium CG11_big_fil_rev_8_21_14_0_20_42_23]PJA19982.1 MAG: hypothetical protein COX62_05470 [Deltaproteobacteria bacterium CG_4_10_14_0_2_um_filter_43_8]PJC64653.1 MAG: hypothetical protein CO021_03060 [Deltaproteobacteria bacterium CG_4_9_14_0_2_um_filter_42_21]